MAVKTFNTSSINSSNIKRNRIKFNKYFIIISRMYLSSGQAIGMVIVRLSVRPSVHHGCTVPKWCKIGPKLQLIIGKNSYMGFQMK